MNKYFITDRPEKAKKAIEILKLFNQVKVNIDKSKISELLLANSIYMESFELVECESALSYKNLSSRCSIIEILSLREHINIPDKLLMILKQHG